MAASTSQFQIILWNTNPEIINANAIIVEDIV